MSIYWPEFAKVATAHLLAVASPGPDFAVVLHQAVTHGRRTALWTALGVSTPICLHVAYSLFGLALLLQGSATLYEVIKLAGAAYLAWMGLQCLTRKPRAILDEGHAGAETRPSAPSAWRTGLFTNALNPKVALFFVAIFATLVSPATPMVVRAGYGAWICLSTMAWFAFVAYFFTRRRVRETFNSCGVWIDRSLGLFFFVLAASLALSGGRQTLSKAASPSMAARLQ